MGMPSFASSSQSDAGVTRATLTPGTLILNKDSHPTVTDIKSLGINTELSLANQQVNKPNIDKLKENQEIAALTGQVGSFAVGELGQRMRLEEGSWQKAALHGAVGALSAQLSKGNVKAGAAAGAATEVINTQIANALAAHTDLSPQARNNLQQVTAMVAGATAGNLVGNNTNSTVQGANTGLASEVFNRQLHPSEIQRIKELANGDKEKEQRLLVASCALIHCSAHLSEDNPAYQEMKAREVLGGTAEYATERALLSKQTQRLSDAWGAGTTQPLFNYNGVYATKDKATAFDEKYAFTTRTLGAAQSVGGAAIMVASYGGVVAACKLSVGIACGPAVAAGAAGATYGLDNLNAGAKSLADGKPHATWGAQAISKTFGVPLDSAELLYSLPSLAGGAKTLAQGSKVVGKSVAEEVTKTTKQIDETFARGSHIKLGKEQYTYLRDGQFIGPNGGRIINTGRTDSVTNNYIYQRMNKTGDSLGNEFYMMSSDRKQIAVNKPESLVFVNQSGRPTFQQSELDVGKQLGGNYRLQVSYLNGKEVPYGTPSSVRPDYSGNSISIEVKNYDIHTNRQALINEIVRQTKEREIHLPKGMVQTIQIDLRGQRYDLLDKIDIQNKINTETKGLIDGKNIQFLEDR